MTAVGSSSQHSMVDHPSTSSQAQGLDDSSFVMRQVMEDLLNRHFRGFALQLETQMSKELRGVTAAIMQLNPSKREASNSPSVRLQERQTRRCRTAECEGTTARGRPSSPPRAGSTSMTRRRSVRDLIFAHCNSDGVDAADKTGQQQPDDAVADANKLHEDVTASEVEDDISHFLRSELGHGEASLSDDKVVADMLRKLDKGTDSSSETSPDNSPRILPAWTSTSPKRPVFEQHLACSEAERSSLPSEAPSNEVAEESHCQVDLEAPGVVVSEAMEPHPQFKGIVSTEPMMIMAAEADPDRNGQSGAGRRSWFERRRSSLKLPVWSGGGKVNDSGGAFWKGNRIRSQSTRTFDAAQAVQGTTPTSSTAGSGSSMKLVWRDRPIEKLVKSHGFDYAICVFIILNAANIGVQTNVAAIRKGHELPLSLRVIEMGFCVVFTVELALRMWVYRGNFCCMQGWQWNFFDCVVVGLQLVEETLTLLQINSSENMNFSFMRIMRILRLIRVMRLVKVLRLIRELRTLVASISASLRALFWTVILMLLLIYSVSLYLTQLVADTTTDCEPDMQSNCEALDNWYGSVPRAMLTLFQAITGGVDWDLAVRPLTEAVSPLLAFFFSIYIAFACLAMLNVVTGVFVESVLLSAKIDKDQYLVNNAREILKTVGDRAMNLQDFRLLVQTSQMAEFFKGIDVDMQDAESVFWLMDTDRSGTVDPEEFLAGCLRLKGPARALDNAMLIQEVRSMRKKLLVLQQNYTSEQEVGTPTLNHFNSRDPFFCKGVTNPPAVGNSPKRGDVRAPTLEGEESSPWTPSACGLPEDSRA